MTTILEPPFTVSPRRAHEAEPNLTGFTLIHRALRCAPHTLAVALTRPPADDPARRRERRRAEVRFGRELIGEIRTHHEREDDVLWPLIVASAGERIDLAPLTADHEALGPLLDCAEQLLDAYERAGGPALAVRLAATLLELAEALDEHIAEEELLVFPVIRQYVSPGDFERCERLFQQGCTVGHLAFLLPWLMAHATPRERSEAMARAGLPLRVLLRLTTPRYRRLVAALD